MRLPLATALMILAAPVQAIEVTHSYGGRFGVSYTGGQGQGRTQGHYEGHYTTRFEHRTDNGVTFRFDLSIIAGNIPDDERRGSTARPLTGSVGIDLQTD